MKLLEQSHKFYNYASDAKSSMFEVNILSKRIA